MKFKKPFLYALIKDSEWILHSLAWLMLTALSVTGQSPPADEAGDIRLVVRGDDMGISQAVNQAIIDCYKNGIETSVELLVPGPWFLEAVEMLKENPGLDVGIHLTLTSEWELLKWRPVTDCPSLIDSNGYFFPVIWPGEDFSQDQALRSQSWDIVDVEKELRGQIELALKHLPEISHISGHMGFQSMSPEVDRLLEKLSAEYNLLYRMNFDRLDFKKNHSDASYVPAFKEALLSASPGTYLFVEHPARNGPEMRSVFMKGYMDVAEDRQKVTDLFLDEGVKQLIREQGIQLINYQDLQKSDR